MQQANNVLPYPLHISHSEKKQVSPASLWSGLGGLQGTFDPTRKVRCGEHRHHLLGSTPYLIFMCAN